MADCLVCLLVDAGWRFLWFVGVITGWTLLDSRTPNDLWTPRFFVRDILERPGLQCKDWEVWVSPTPKDPKATLVSWHFASAIRLVSFFKAS